jgi:DNA processing protein
MALGIDSEAHRGALARDGITVAVLGAGLDTIPAGKHRVLAEKIAKHGAVVSEFKPDASPQPYHFPQRNRIISGLAHGVLVIEAAEQSGSLITARLAGEQGREVFALPGSIHNPLARGCHRLIRQGAKLVQSVEDIFEEFPALVQWEQQRTAANEQALTKPLRKLLAQIGYDPVSVDTLLQRTGGELTELYANLMKLELRGLILNRSDGYVLSTS